VLRLITQARAAAADDDVDAAVALFRDAAAAAAAASGQGRNLRAIIVPLRMAASVLTFAGQVKKTSIHVA
jgi:hypothetical protein